MSGFEEEIDFSAFEETDAYDRYSLPQLVDPLYSKLAREVQNFKGEKIGAASAISYLKGKGVKSEEIKWSGIVAFLDGEEVRHEGRTASVPSGQHPAD